jgi:23S rRNA pseudouridine2605 synthase
MRLNKYISHNSTYSRRDADELIKNGRVKIGNKLITDLATKVEDGDEVYLNGKLLEEKEDYTVVVYHKPYREIVSKKDPEGRKTIFESLPSKFKHFITVGRLDYNSEGLLLLTDSPHIATILMESNLERIYNVKLDGSISQRVEDAMQNGLTLKDATKGAHPLTQEKSMEFAPFSAYRITQNTPTLSKMKIAITEGKNREIRRFFGHFNLNVTKLKRVSYGWIDLNALPVGKTRYLQKDEYTKLRDLLWDIKRGKMKR